MSDNFGPGVLGGVVLVDPDTGRPYKVTPSGGGGGAVDSVNGEVGVVVLNAQDVLPTQADQTGKFLATDGSVAGWTALPDYPPSVATIIYEADTDARPSADIVFWIPETPALDDPTNAIPGDIVLRSVQGAATVYVHNGTTYELTGGRTFIGPEDPTADGFTVTDGDQWIDVA